MTQANANHEVYSTNNQATNQQTAADSLIDRIVQKLYKVELPGREHFENYMRHKWRMNHKPSTLNGSFGAVRDFLTFYSSIGKDQLREIVTDDVEAFVEHLQDRGLKITTTNTRLKWLLAFIRFLIDQKIIDESILKHKIKLRLPIFLPRAIAPGDVRKILGAIEEPRDRALILVLLRTAMRIGEALRLTMRDIDLRERKINIYEGEKNCVGRVVYLSDDAVMALKLWFKERDTSKEYLFPGLRGSMCYTTARNIFTRYLRETGLQHKGYTPHSLRHYAEFRIMPSYILGLLKSPQYFLYLTNPSLLDYSA